MKRSAGLAGAAGAGLLIVLAGCTGRGTSLESKLQQYQQHFDRARQYFAQRTHDDRGINPSEWIRLNDLLAGREFSRAEKEELKRRQKNWIEAALQRARLDSPISLDRIRRGGRQKVSAFCAELPKGGLNHVHFPYLLRPAELQSVLLELNPLIPVRQVAALAVSLGAPRNFLANRRGPVRFRDLRPQERAQLWPSPSARFARFEEFKIHAHLIQLLIQGDPSATPAVLARLWKEFLSQAEREKLSYVEVSLTWPGIPETLRAFKDAQELALTRHQIVLRAVQSYYRGIPPRRQPGEPLPMDALPGAPGLFVGVDSYGEEDRFPLLETAPAVFGRPAAGLRLKTHAGEREPKVSSIRTALLIGVERIGHAIDLDDPLLLEYAKTRKITVETALSSNQALGNWKRIKTHPFLRFVRLGIPVVLGTDNPTLFDTDMNRECALAVAQTDLQYSELRQMVESSIDASFAELPVRERLRKQLLQDLREFENHWGVSPGPSATPKGDRSRAAR